MMCNRHNVLLSGNDINGLFFLLYLPKLWGGQVQELIFCFIHSLMRCVKGQKEAGKGYNDIDGESYVDH